MKLPLILLLIPLVASAQPMTTPPKSHPKTHFALMAGRRQLLLNVTHWTSFKIKSDYPVSIFEDGCRDNQTGIVNSSFVCSSDLDITISDDRSPLMFGAPPNVVRIKWVTTGNEPIPVFKIAPGSQN